MDILCIAESKLVGNSELNVTGYKYLGHNRKHLHRKAKTGPGGVEVFVRRSRPNMFNVSVFDTCCEGII